ncbi:DEKNAAC103532 [Brettanomyces naardenensis]|uniref:DEKNAAC103532 n=1 Tax=Brettanomyces naardenensis TaxID=13370 RepID=A0A448YNM8_BRENA|nr:DEKNAAC103532 [Brettanomyces naardenensis]
MSMMNRTFISPPTKELPSIKDLFPTLESPADAHSPPSSSSSSSLGSSTIDSFLSRATTAAAASATTTVDSFPSTKQSYPPTPFGNNYTFSNVSNTSCFNKDTASTTTTSIQSPPLLNSSDEVKTQLHRLMDITSQIETLFKGTRDFNNVPRQLLYDGCARLQQIKYVYEEWIRTKEHEAARARKSKSFQNMEEQAVKALTSMNENHLSPPSSTSSSPSSLSCKRGREESWDAKLQSTETRLSPPISPKSIVTASQPFKRRKSNPTLPSLPISRPFTNPSTSFRQQQKFYSMSFAPPLARKAVPPPVSGPPPLSTSATVEQDSPLAENECTHCRSKDTPEWRRGPEGERTLCNACGLFYAKLCKKYGEPKAKDVMRDRRTKGMETDRRVSICSSV